MNNSTKKISVGDAVKVKDKVYLVLDIQYNRVFCRQFKFTKQGKFRYYQDYNFPLTACYPVNRRDQQLINQQRIKASIQRKPYSAIRSNYVQHLIR